MVIQQKRCVLLCVTFALALSVIQVAAAKESDNVSQAAAACSKEEKGLLGAIPDEVMPDTHLRSRVDALKRVRSHAFTRKR